MNENEISKIERRIDARIGVGVKKIIGVTVVLFVLLAFGISSPIMWQFGRVNTKFDEVKALVEKNTAVIRQLSESINVKNEIEAAKQGSAIAQFNLGEMYNYGRGVPEDAVEAVKWYRKAAEQGNAEAQYNLGVMYRKGEGVPEDAVEAVKWYRKAAEQGLANAQYNLGVAYHKGEGVPQDYAEAVQWYRKAAEQGLANAQYNLGVAYHKGEGVPKDYVEANAWHLLAKANGIKESSEAVSSLEERLTAEQMEKGQARAAALRRLIEQKSAK